MESSETAQGSAIWEACRAVATPGPLEGVLTRVVESQEEIATMTIVDGNLADQDRLERLLDASKPAHRLGTEGLHYLLATPLRAEGIEVIEFESARDPDGGANVALCTPSALGAAVPSAATEWVCTSTDDAVTFRSSTRPARLVSFEAAAFRVEGVLPRPA